MTMNLTNLITYLKGVKNEEPFHVLILSGLTFGPGIQPD
jgi:hypothetical protein